MAQRTQSTSPAWVPVSHARLLHELLVEAGQPAMQALNTAGIPVAALYEPTARVTRQQFFLLERAFATFTRDRRALWLEAGLRYRMTSDDVYGQALLASPTFRRMLDVVEIGFEYSSSLARWRSLMRGGDVLGVQVVLESIPAELREFTLYRDLGAGLSTFRHLWGAPFPLSHVEVGASVAICEDLASLTGLTVRQDRRRTAFVWDPALSDVALPFADETMQRHWLAELRRLADSRGGGSFRDRVRYAITDHPIYGATMTAVASRLGLSPRTVQRRLQEEGVTFRALIHEARIDAAKRALAGAEQPMNRVASALGYASLTSFSHAFRRCTGIAPSRFRDGFADAEADFVAAAPAVI